MGGWKFLVYGINVKNRGPAGWIGGNVATRTLLDAIENILARLPGIRGLAKRVLGVNGYWAWPGRVVLHTVGIIRRTDVHEGIHVDLIIVDPKSSADDQIFTTCRLGSKHDTRGKIFQVLVEDSVESGA